MSTLKLKGSTSGYVELTAPSTAGDNTITLPTTAGTALVKDASNNTEVGTGVVIGSPASNTFTVTTNSTERIRITSTGLMGLGTNNPGSLLECYGTGTSTAAAVNGTGRYRGFEIYASGTRTSYFHDDSTDSLVRLWTTRSNLVFGISDGERARIDSSGRLLVGTSSAFTNVYLGPNTTQAPLQVRTATNSYDAGATLLNYSATGYAPTLTLGLSKSNTAGSNTVVASGDELGYFQFVGNDGTNFRTAARIEARVDGTPGANDMPGRLVFSTTADGASSPTERMRIDSSGRMGLGTNAPSSILDVYSTSAFVKNQDGAANAANPGIQLQHGGTINGSWRHDGRLEIGGQDANAKIRLNPDGTVGIGATTVDEKLHLEGSSGANTNIKVESTATGSERSSIEFWNGTISRGRVGGDNTFDGLTLDSSTTEAASVIRFRTAGGSGFNEKARIDSSGRLLVGTSSNLSGSGNRYLQVSNSQPFVIFHHNVNNPTADTTLAGLEYGGQAGGSYVPGAFIRAQTDGAWASGDAPTRLTFSVTADGASSPTERMRLNRKGYLYVSPNNSIYDANEHVIDNNLGGFNVLQIRGEDPNFSADGGGALAVGVKRSANSAYTLAGWYSGNGTSPFSDRKFRFRGDGNAYADGSWSGGGADYAEYFEWSDGNAMAEDRRGISVVLDGDKIREAVEGEDPIGVISANPTVIGDADDAQWKNKYLRTEYGSFDLDENGDQKLNPDYNPDVEYVSRENRPEWDCVGLMGKLRIRKGQITGARWIKMRDVSDNVEEWLVR